MIASDRQHPTEATPPPTPKRPAPPRRRLHSSLDVRERRKKLVRYALGAGVAILIVNAIIGDSGYLAGLRAQREYDAAAVRLAQVQSDNRELIEQKQRLKDDPAALEDAARRELGLVREGETLVIVRDGKPAAK